MPRFIILWVVSRGVATGGGISGYIPPKSVYLKFFMWLFCLLDPGQIRYRAIYTHPNQIPGYASGCLPFIVKRKKALKLCPKIEFFFQPNIYSSNALAANCGKWQWAWPPRVKVLPRWMTTARQLNNRLRTTQRQYVTLGFIILTP